jgi:tRNA (guanine-N7-)-methyltransferase
MHGMHARLPRNFVLEERIERYADAIEVEPRAYAGRWANACYPLDPGDPRASFREVRVDLGCGKGAFVAESARREPDVLFVGIDSEPICIAYAAQHALEQGLRNAVFVPATGAQLAGIFGPCEVARIHLNFPTPYPRRRDAHRRLTLVDRLMEYRGILAPGGDLYLRTDSQPFRDFTLAQLKIAGYEITWQSDDARAALPDEPGSEYERRLCDQGARVLALIARPGPCPQTWEQTAPLSLVEYLPEDLEELDYVPYGMNASVTSLRRMRAKRKRCAQ